MSRQDGLGRLFFVYILQLASFISISFGLRRFAGNEEYFLFTPEFFFFWVLFTALAIVVVVRMGIFFPAKMKLLELGWNQKSLGKNVGLGILGFVGCFIALGLTLELLGFGTIKNLISSFIDQAPRQRLAYLLIGIHAAFLEESVFRGYLQPQVAKRWGKWPALFLVAAFFSIYHLQFHPLPLAVKFLFGIVFGLLSFSGCLVAPATAHLLVWLILGES